MATLNDETDWRNGLRVQLLQNCKVVMHAFLPFFLYLVTTFFNFIFCQGSAFGRKVWREVDSDKSGNARVTVLTKDEGKKHSTEHHDDSLDDKASNIFFSFVFFHLEALEVIFDCAAYLLDP